MIYSYLFLLIYVLIALCLLYIIMRHEFGIISFFSEFNKTEIILSILFFILFYYEISAYLYISDLSKEPNQPSLTIASTSFYYFLFQGATFFIVLSLLLTNTKPSLNKILLFSTFATLKISMSMLYSDLSNYYICIKLFANMIIITLPFSFYWRLEKLRNKPLQSSDADKS